MKKRPNAKLYLILTGLSLVGGAVVVTMEMNSFNDQRMKVEELRLQLKDEGNVETRLEESTRKLEESRTKLTHLESNIPTTAYIPTMLQELEKVGEEEGIDVTAVRPIMRPVAKQAEGDSKTLQTKAYEEVDIEVKGRGSYDAVEKFVKRLQSFPKIVAARTVSMEPKIDPFNPLNQQLELTVELRAFMFKQQSAPKPKEAGA